MNLLVAAHQQCSKHRDPIQASQQCGCFSCLALFPPQEIQEWTDHNTTALCPRCGVDAVLPQGLATPDFLQEMEAHWFHCLFPLLN